MSNPIFVLYHLKDEENIKEIYNISKHYNIKLILIPRPNYYYSSLPEDLLIKYSLDEIIQEYPSKKIYFIETYGDSFINEISLTKNAIFVLGAEDYGIPYYIVEKYENKAITVLIPISKAGSYNVTTSFIMVLSELFR